MGLKEVLKSKSTDELNAYLTSSDVTEQTAGIVREILRERADTPPTVKKWGGFMRFYWVILGIGAITSTVAFICNIKMDALVSNYWIVLGDAAFIFNYAALCIYVIVAFNKRTPNAVTLAKIQIYTQLVSSAFNLIFANGSVDDIIYSPINLAGRIMWCAIFMLFLYIDKQIKEVYPKGTRHLYRGDKIWLCSALASVILFLVLGCVRAVTNV